MKLNITCSRTAISPPHHSPCNRFPEASSSMHKPTPPKPAPMNCWQHTPSLVRKLIQNLKMRPRGGYHDLSVSYGGRGHPKHLEICAEFHCFPSIKSFRLVKMHYKCMPVRDVSNFSLLEHITPLSVALLDINHFCTVAVPVSYILFESGVLINWFTH